MADNVTLELLAWMVTDHRTEMQEKFDEFGTRMTRLEQRLDEFSLPMQRIEERLDGIGRLGERIGALEEAH